MPKNSHQSRGTMNKCLLSKCVAEGVGTFALVFIGCGAVMVSEQFGLTSIAIPVAFGLIVASMIYALGHVSGAHFNPAVTIAFALARHFPKKQIFPYISAQYLGAISAIALLSVLLPHGQSYGATVPTIMMWRAFIWEITLTFFLMFVIISVATDTRAVGSMAGAAIGSTVMLCALVGGPVTGASMNPARSLAPNIFQSEFNSLWLYTLAPIVGAVLAALLYEWIKNQTQQDQQTPSK